MCQKSVFLTITFLSSLAFSSLDTPSKFNIEEAKKRCYDKPNQEDIVYSNDFPWGMSKKGMQKSFDKIYHTGKRLKDRAYYSPKTQSFVLPHFGDKEVRITELFLKSITYQAEKALERKYVDFLFFPDMGHAHFFIPQKLYDTVLNPIEKQHLMYEKMLAHPNIKMLYHTAEQLKMQGEDKKLLTDRHTQRRFYTRNIVGNNNADANLDIIFASDSSSFNTVRDYPGTRYWGAGFDIHSTSQGCFAYNYKGKTYYFDISLSSLPYKPSEKDQWSDFY